MRVNEALNPLQTIILKQKMCLLAAITRPRSTKGDKTGKQLSAIKKM